MVGVLELTVRFHDRDEGRKPIDDEPKPTLVCMEGVLGPCSILDIGVHSTPLDDLSGRVDQGTRPHMKPAILAIDATQASFHFGRLASSQNGSPAFRDVMQVVGVDRDLPASATGFVHGQAGVFAPASIEKVDVPIRERRPHQSGQRIDDAGELVVHAGSFVTVAMMR